MLLYMGRKEWYYFWNRISLNYSILKYHFSNQDGHWGDIRKDYSEYPPQRSLSSWCFSNSTVQFSITGRLPPVLPWLHTACQETLSQTRCAQLLLQPAGYFSQCLLSRTDCSSVSVSATVRGSCMWMILIELTQSPLPSLRNRYRNKPFFSSEFT